MTVRNDYRDLARDDDRRKQDDAKAQVMQSQIDEMRQLLRELTSRQQRLEDQVKTNEASLAQHRMSLDQHRHEVAQSAQARQLEEARYRQQLTELSARIDDSTRPIRSLQAHVAELLESVRRQRDDVGLDTKRFDELRTLIDHLAAHGERQIAVSQTLRDSIESVRVEIERQQREIHRADDQVKIVEQESRRRFSEILQQIESLDVRLTSELGGITALQAQIEDLRADSELIPPELELLRQADQQLDVELTRVHSQARERDSLTTERIEEVRQQFDTLIHDLEEVTEKRFERVNARHEQLDEVDRELAYRLNLIEMQLEELQQVDLHVRREIWYLNEQRARLRVEQAQHELESVIEARRAADQRAVAGNQPVTPQEQ